MDDLLGAGESSAGEPGMDSGSGLGLLSEVVQDDHATILDNGQTTEDESSALLRAMGLLVDEETPADPVMLNPEPSVEQDATRKADLLSMLGIDLGSVPASAVVDSQPAACPHSAEVEERPSRASVRSRFADAPAFRSSHEGFSVDLPAAKGTSPAGRSTASREEEPVALADPVQKAKQVRLVAVKRVPLQNEKPLPKPAEARGSQGELAKPTASQPVPEAPSISQSQPEPAPEPRFRQEPDPEPDFEPEPVSDAPSIPQPQPQSESAPMPSGLQPQPEPASSGAQPQPESVPEPELEPEPAPAPPSKPDPALRDFVASTASAKAAPASLRRFSMPEEHEPAYPRRSRATTWYVACALLLALAAACTCLAVCSGSPLSASPLVEPGPQAAIAAGRPDSMTFEYTVRGPENRTYQATEVASFGADGFLDCSAITIDVLSADEAERLLAHAREEFGSAWVGGSVEEGRVAFTVDAEREGIDREAYSSLLMSNTTDCKVIDPSS